MTVHYENSRNNAQAIWRRELQLKALGAITYAGGAMTAHDIGRLLKISPRALRNLLVRSNLCNVDYRKTGAVFTVKLSHIPPSPLLIAHNAD